MRRAYTLLVINAVVMALLTVVVSLKLGHPIRDPDGFLGPAWIRMPMLILLAFLADVVPRSLWRARGRPGSFLPQARQVVREHWTKDRIQLVVIGVIAFYVVYVSYRNLKNFLPFLRPLNQNDYKLHQMDRWLFFGSDPATVLHNVLGTGFMAHFLSWIYLLFLPLVPITIAIWVVWSRNVNFGYWFATAYCMTWTLGTLSYYILPTLGPNFFFPWLYSDLANTGVKELQEALYYGRQNIIHINPFADGVQSVAGFASLHVGITMVVALVAQYTIRSVIVKALLWANVAITIVATLYFGWHYIADDIAGAFIAWFSFYIGAKATGQKFSKRGRRSHPTSTTADVPADDH